MLFGKSGLLSLVSPLFHGVDSPTQECLTGSVCLHARKHDNGSPNVTPEIQIFRAALWPEDQKLKKSLTLCHRLFSSLRGLAVSAGLATSTADLP